MQNVQSAWFEVECNGVHVVDLGCRFFAVATAWLFWLRRPGREPITDEFGAYLGTPDPKVEQSMYIHSWIRQQIHSDTRRGRTRRLNSSTNARDEGPPPLMTTDNLPLARVTDASAI